MGDYVVECSLGYKAYGQEQYDYSVGGADGKDYGHAVSKACLCRAFGVEACLNAYTEIVKMHQEKLEGLGKCLAEVAEAGSHFDKDSKTTDRYPGDGTVATLKDAYALSMKYCDTNNYIGDGYITYEDVQRANTSIQYQIDLENTDLQEDMVQLQSLVDKRDSSYKLAGTLLDKINSTLQNGLANIR